MQSYTSKPPCLHLHDEKKTIYFGYCPHPVTVYTKGHIKGYIHITILYILSNYPRYTSSFQNLLKRPGMKGLGSAAKSLASMHIQILDKHPPELHTALA